MAQTPFGVNEAAQKLDEATVELGSAIKYVNGLPKWQAWSKRSGDLGLLQEQIIDIRQQLELLEMEVAREPEPIP